MLLDDFIIHARLYSLHMEYATIFQIYQAVKLIHIRSIGRLNMREILSACRFEE